MVSWALAMFGIVRVAEPFYEIQSNFIEFQPFIKKNELL